MAPLCSFVDISNIHWSLWSKMHMERKKKKKKGGKSEIKRSSGGAEDTE
jgi:hypothetical protein